MNTNYISIIPVVFVAVVVIAALYRSQTRRKERYFLAEILEAIGVLGGVTVGAVFITASGILGLFLRLGVLAIFTLPVLLLAAYLRKRRKHAT